MDEIIIFNGCKEIMLLLCSVIVLVELDVSVKLMSVKICSFF